MQLPTLRESPYSERNAPWVFLTIGAFFTAFCVFAAGDIIGWW